LRRDDSAKLVREATDQSFNAITIAMNEGTTKMTMAIINGDLHRYVALPQDGTDNDPGATALHTLDALGSASIVENNPQTMVTDAMGAASDVCTGVCMAVGAGVGAGTGFVVANGPGAVAGFDVGIGLGAITSQFICGGSSSTCTDSVPRDAGVPDTGVPDGSVPDGGVVDPPSTTPATDETGGFSLTNGGVESNNGSTDTSGNVDSTQSTSTTTDDSGGVCSADAGVCTDGVGDTTGGSGLPADDGGDSASNPLTPFTGRSMVWLAEASSLLAADLAAGLTSLGSNLAIRA
jgi:hypothetical protein